MSVEKKSRHSFFIAKFLEGVNHNEKLRKQNRQKKNKKEVLP